VISAIAVPYILILLPFIVMAFYRLFKYSINSQRETSRIESVTKSPLISYLSESYAGATTIRSFKKEEDFIARNYVL
jgi:ABC-type multidrug transport system fused ATPase/permease subunit